MGSALALHPKMAAAAVSSPPRLLDKGDYSVGWVSALPLELRAALACLDEQHATLSRDRDDHNTYVFGRVHQHNIVLACLPSGDYGNNSAANVAVHMRRSFPGIQILLLVGIAGGVPFPADVRLGDVVVGQRIIQHDLGKELPGGDFQHTGAANSLHSAIGSTLSLLRATIEPPFIKPILDSMQIARPYLRRALGRSRLVDVLYHESYEHFRGKPTCASCDRSQLVVREDREYEDEPVVHFGTITSGDQVIKDAKLRDQIGQAHEALCIKMEAAGLKHDLPSLVVRGICGYADSHKNKEWQDYAAATAATFAKVFLRHETHVPPSHVFGQPAAFEAPSTVTPKSLAEKPKTALEHRKKVLNSLFFDQIDARYDDISEPHDDTCRWMVQIPEHCEWLDGTRHFAHHEFWIRGEAGAGKSIMMKYLFETAQNTQPHDIVLAFFFHARDGDLEKSTMRMYRSICYQLLKAVPRLKLVLDSFKAIGWTVNKLHKLFLKAVAKLSPCRLSLFIDALDECAEEEGLAMVKRFQVLARDAFASAVTFRICFSSRPYPAIDMRKGIQIVLEEQSGNATGISRYVRAELSIWPRRVQDDLSREVIQRANGVFLWAALVVALLCRDWRHGRTDAARVQERLEQLPSELTELFREAIHGVADDNEDLKLCVQ